MLSARAFLVAILFLAGCQIIDHDPVEVNFGDSYTILTQGSDAPRFDGAQIHLTVEYGGGCETHRFTPKKRITSKKAEFWFEHNDFDDPCDALIHERLTIDVPPSVATYKQLLLLNPRGEAFNLSRIR